MRAYPDRDLGGSGHKTSVCHADMADRQPIGELGFQNNEDIFLDELISKVDECKTCIKIKKSVLEEMESDIESTKEEIERIEKEIRSEKDDLAGYGYVVPDYGDDPDGADAAERYEETIIEECDIVEKEQAIKELQKTKAEEEKKLKELEDEKSDTQCEIEMLTSKLQKMLEQLNLVSYYIIHGGRGLGSGLRYRYSDLYTCNCVPRHLW